MKQKIIRVEATPLFIPGSTEIDGIQISGKLSGVIVEIETEVGIIGHGFTAITDEEVIATIIKSVIEPNIIGMDALCRETVNEKLYWLLTPRGQSGYASHAISAIDIALWDIAGKALELPIWKLLGGARQRVDCYTTFGFPSLTQSELARTAKALVNSGQNRLKMLVGHHAMRYRDEGKSLNQIINEDARRVAAVRHTVGPNIELYIDANCGLDYYHAVKLAELVKDYNISFFEEPIIDNDPEKLSLLSKTIDIPIAAGQSEGKLTSFRDMLMNKSVSVLQPNVCVCGGYSAGVKAANLARAFGISIDNGGTFPFHNMHLHAGVSNGGMVEFHLVVSDIYKKIFTGLPVVEGNTLTLSDKPGLGFSLNKDAIKELSRGPFSKGLGKA